MKRIPRKYQYPLTVSMVSSTMLVGTSGIMVYQTTGITADFILNWATALTHIFPYAALLLMIVAPLVKLLTTRVMLQSES